MESKSTQVPDWQQQQQLQQQELQQQQRRQREESGRWRWWQILLLSGAIGLLTYSQLDRIGSLKKALMGLGSNDILDMGYPDTALFQDDELDQFLNDLYDDFGNSRHHCPTRDGQDHIQHAECSEEEIQQKQPYCGKLSIAFPPEYARHPAPPRRGEPFCKPGELESSSQVFSFTPDQFQRAAVYVDGRFSRDTGIVTVDRSLDDKDDDGAILVNVTLFAGRPELLDEVEIAGFDNKGQYSVEVKRHAKGHHHHHHHHRKPPSKEDCLTYHIHVVFPNTLETFEDLDLHIKAARWIGTRNGDELNKLVFGKFRAGLGHGPIAFSDIKAKRIMLASLDGVIKGSYHPTERLSAATVRGTTELTSLSGHANVTAVSLLGPASATLPADRFKGNFIVSSLTGGPIVKAPNPKDIHIERNRLTFKAGYYKEKNTGYRVIVHSKHGDSSLNFKDMDG